MAKLALATLLVAVSGAQPPLAFEPSADESRLFELIRSSQLQQRPQMVLDPRLCQAARKHAIDMQARRYFSHTSLSGVTANQRIVNEGFALPASYPVPGNSVESIAGSVVNTPEDTFLLWRDSPAHATHVFGQQSFFRGQVLIGIGQADPAGLPYGTWVFLSTPVPPGEEVAMTDAEAQRARVEQASGAEFRMRPLPSGTVVEVWETSGILGEWNLERTTRTGSGGYISLGPRVAHRGFFRLRYLEK